MKVNRKQLLASLESVSPGLATKESIEQSSCFVFKGDRLLTMNDDVACSAPNPLEGTEGAVPAKPLMDLLDKLAEEFIEVEQKGKELLVKGKGRRAGIRIHEEVVLPVDSVDQPEEWRELPDGFSEAVDVVRHSVSKDDSMFSLTCIHVTPDHLEACDNFEVVRWPIEIPIGEACLIRGESIKSIIGKGMKQVGATESWIHFRDGDDLSISCRRWSEEYADLTAILGTEGVKMNLPAGLSEAVTAAGIFSEDGVAGETVMVKLAKGKLLLRGEGPDGWYEHRKKVDWDGDSLEFLVNPSLLIEIVKRADSCLVSSNQLRVETDQFKYAACLGKKD